MYFLATSEFQFETSRANTFGRFWMPMGNPMGNGPGKIVFRLRYFCNHKYIGDGNFECEWTF